MLNTVRGALRCVAVKAPGFGDRRRTDAGLVDFIVSTIQLRHEDLV